MAHAAPPTENPSASPDLGPPTQQDWSFVSFSSGVFVAPAFDGSSLAESTLDSISAQADVLDWGGVEDDSGTVLDGHMWVLTAGPSTTDLVVLGDTQPDVDKGGLGDFWILDGPFPLLTLPTAAGGGIGTASESTSSPHAGLYPAGFVGPIDCPTSVTTVGTTWAACDPADDDSSFGWWCSMTCEETTTVTHELKLVLMPWGTYQYTCVETSVSTVRGDCDECSCGVLA